ATILNEEVAKQKRDEGLSDGEIESVIAREVKRRAESARLYRENNRPELAEPEEQEMAVLEEFLPEQMSEEDLRRVVEEKIANLGANSPKDMGRVIGAVKAEVGNAADGALLAQIVKNALTNK
ncbi:GatB/YqeY, partial [Candidatus Saccharibacteria bacterium]|nr:GatB/YqeY [Candidatus Saccharibacteria bacterium]